MKVENQTYKIFENHYPDFWIDDWKRHFESQLMLLEIHENSFNVLYDGGGWQSRHSTLLQALEIAIKNRKKTTTKRCFVFTGDEFPDGVKTQWKLLSTVGSRKDIDIVIPDAYSFSWKEIGINDFEVHNKLMRQHTIQTMNANNEIKKSFWRGSIQQNKIRELFVNAFKGHEYFDIDDSSIDKNFKHMSEIGEYAVLMDFPGQGFSGRLKHLLMSGRPVVVYPRNSWDWVTMRLEPGLHFPLSLPNISNMADICNLLLNNKEIQNFYVQHINDCMSLLKRETLMNGIIEKIESCD